jgi:hypothetical protein
MKKLLLALGLILPLTAPAKQSFPFLNATVILDDSLDAALANRKSDVYTSGLTTFDLAIRLHREGASEPEYLDQSAKSMRNWPEDEAAQLKAAFIAIQTKANTLGLKIPLPDTIHLCKTTGREEFGAEGYTRHNRIMLNTAAEGVSTGLVAHELWHVISRLNAAARNRAYAVFGFKACNRVDYKPAFKGQVISNPDCPFIEHYMRIDKDGRQQDVAIVLYSRSPYVKGGGLMDYVAVGLLALEGGDSNKKPVIKDGKPLVYDFSACPDFFRQAGKNTEYMLHIEELTAEHFAAIMAGRELKQPEYATKLGNALK